VLEYFLQGRAGFASTSGDPIDIDPVANIVRGGRGRTASQSSVVFTAAIRDSIRFDSVIAAATIKEHCILC